MALPKEPRQKMINVMYLVLTAMLALNVSSEILNAFKTVKRSLEHSSDAIELKNNQIFKSFEEKLKDPTKAAKAQEWQPLALQAKKLADDTYTYIESLKNELIVEAGAKTPTDSVNFKADNLDAATRLFVEQKKKGPELLKRLQDFRDRLLKIHPDIAAEFSKTLPMDLSVPITQNKELHKWEEAYFHMTPAIAALTILSKFQNDVRNSEAQVVEFCHKKVGEVEITYDQFKAIAAANSTYLMPGEDLVITAGIGSFSSKALPTITVNGSGTTPTTDVGIYEYKGKAESVPGKYKKTVVVSYKDPNTGKDASVTKEIEYTVGQQSGLTVSTDKTRVFYAGGLENEISVTGSGGAEKISLSIEGPGIETIPKGGGLYIVKCSQPGPAKVIASDGKNKQEFTIPIRRVPPPIPKVNGSAGGDMAVAKFKAAQGINASMGDFIFGDLKWTVEAYRIYFTGPGFEEKGEGDDVNSNAFGGQVRTWINRCQSGTAIIIDNIKVVSSTGERRTLEQGITFVLE